MIDDRTPAQALPLPHPQNLLQEDVPRLRQALALLDELLAPGGHGHAVADISGLTTLLQPLASKTYVDEQTAQRAPANHSHSLASLGAAAVSQGSQFCKLPMKPNTLFSSTKLIPAMTPPNI